MARWLVISCFAFALVVPAPASAASLDPAFGTDGRVVLDFGGMTNAAAGDLAIQPDGRIIAVGWVNAAFGVVRLLPDVTLDPSFGSGGIVLPSFGSAMQNGTPPRVALQPDGKIVVAGPGVDYSPANPMRMFDFAVMRLTPSGALDPDFGQGGKALFQLGDGSDVAEAVAVQPDGKIVVAGYSVAKDSLNSDFAAIRLTPGGRLDTGFGTGGSAVIPMIPDSGMDSASALALLPDGRVLLAGVTARSATGFDLAAVRLTTQGQPDPSFGSEGRTEFALGSGAWQEIVRSLAVMPDGSFYIGGSALQPGFGPSQVALTHFTATGVADWQMLRPLGTIEDTSSGIVIDGATRYLAVDSRPNSLERKIGVLAVDAAGNPDTTFSTGGALLLHIVANGDDRAAAIARRADGALVELATVRGPNAGNSIFGLTVIVPHATQKIQPPPPDTTPIQQPVAPVSKIAVPKAGSTLRRVTVFKGTASGRLPVERVDVALVRMTGKARAAGAASRCWYLRSGAPAFAVGKPRGGMCKGLIWRRAGGTTSWSYKLRKALPKGRYVLYSVATGGGLRETQGKAGVRNRIAFTVR